MPNHDHPTHEQIYRRLRKTPITLRQLSKEFDRSEDTIEELITQMEEAGYVIARQRSRVSAPKQPIAKREKPSTLADKDSLEVVFASISDLHAGSNSSQPTAFQKFIDIAYHEYGARVVFDSGDVTTGLRGYRGQNLDMVPALRHVPREEEVFTTLYQIDLADTYYPRYPGLNYYSIGGNHDYWHILYTGIDPVWRLAQRREDFHYLGYEAADVPLTDKVEVRLWHPSGGVPYAVSYRSQKALEQIAFEELSRAVAQVDTPKIRMLLAGHLHVQVEFQRGPIYCAQVGCFEGQTNYLKRKQLYPSIGGSIFRLRLTAEGLISRMDYTFIPFTEVEKDWINHPIVPTEQLKGEAEVIEVLFTGEIKPPPSEDKTEQ